MADGTVLAAFAEDALGSVDVITEVRREEALLKTGALQNAIFNSANFSSIATDEKGVIQIFNVGAERMLGYDAVDVVNRITPADISDPQEVIARAVALSAELETTISPGFQALVFKASRGIEDIYELTYIRKDGSRFPAIVSVTALRDDQGAIIGYLLIGTDNSARKQVEAEQMKLDQRLRDQQFYTRSLIESNIDAIMTTDPAGIITDVNKRRSRTTSPIRRGPKRASSACCARRKSPTTSSPPAPATARPPWCPITRPPSTTATGSCKACSPPRATSPNPNVSTRRSRSRTSS
jgi:PAS domain S-box-containing protein